MFLSITTEMQGMKWIQRQEMHPYNDLMVNNTSLGSHPSANLFLAIANLATTLDELISLSEPQGPQLRRKFPAL